MFGVIGKKPIHLMKTEDREKASKIGAKDLPGYTAGAAYAAGLARERGSMSPGSAGHP